MQQDPNPVAAGRGRHRVTGVRKVVINDIKEGIKSGVYSKASALAGIKSGVYSNQKKKKKKDQIRPSAAFWKWHKESRAHDVKLK